VRNSADERAWSAAKQMAIIQLASLMTSPFSRVEMEQRYGTWVEDRLLRSCRSAQPEIYGAAIEQAAGFLRELIEKKDGPPLGIRQMLVRRLVHALHADSQRDILNVKGFAAAAGIRLRTVLTLNGVREVELTSFVKCVKNALVGKRSSQLVLADGSRARVKLSVDRSSSVLIEFAALNMKISEAGVFSASSRKRAVTLASMLKKHPLLPDEEKDWQKVLRLGQVDEVRFVKLVEALRETPEAFASALSRPQKLNNDNMVPRERRYFERLVGPIVDDAIVPYHEKQPTLFQDFLLSKGIVGLRRLAFGCLSANVMPLQRMASIPLSDVESLLDALDPFSLLFGFEICVERYRAGDNTAVVMGHRFLDRIFKDESWFEQRCEVFSACALISSVRLRPLSNRYGANLYWFRLAALAHAGVLTNALSAISDTKKFLKWAVDGSSGLYTWETIPDAREEPRWESEWIGPKSITAEITGRCLNALGRIGKRKIPAPWKARIELAFSRLNPKLSAFFPGPHDGFSAVAWAQRRDADVEKVQALLEERNSFKEAPGLLIVAYAGAVGTSHIPELMRLLEGSNDELASPKSASQILKCCAYVASITRSATLADAVVTRCTRLVTGDSESNQILALMLLAMRACAAHEDLAIYYREIGKVATGFAYLTPESEALNVRVVMEALCERDPRMVASLGRAMFLLAGSALAV